MPKIESIRPGGTLSASFAEYPLPDLLFGILRGNLTGRLDIGLHPEPRNRIYFRDGVPIAVELPDVLEERAIVPAEQAWELEAARARAQLVRLFDVGAVEFTFNEGADRPEQARLTILQSLPIVFEGLRTTKNRGVLERLLADHEGETFVLAATYPRGVDPFEWGPQVEDAIAKLEQEPCALGDLIDVGLDGQTAAAALASLLLAGMLEAREKAAKEASPAKPKSDPRSRIVQSPQQRKAIDESAEKEPSGLVIHYKSGNKVKVPSSSPTASPAAFSAAQAEYELVKARFAHYDGKTYYQILRVAPNTELAQVERAYRFLVRRPDGGDSDDAGSRALKGLYHEAFECLSGPESARRYRALVDWAEKSSNAVRERDALEAEPKVDRAFRALGEGHYGEARALLEWAKRLDPLRGDIPLLLDLARYLAEPTAADPLGIATALVAERQRRPEDERVKLAYAFCLAEENEQTAARALIQTVADREHPMAKRISSKLEG